MLSGALHPGEHFPASPGGSHPLKTVDKAGSLGVCAAGLFPLSGDSVGTRVSGWHSVPSTACPARSEEHPTWPLLRAQSSREPMTSLGFGVRPQVRGQLLPDQRSDLKQVNTSSSFR